MDAQRISALAVELGYAVGPAHIRKLLRRASSRHVVFVAQRDEQVIGWVAVAMRETLISEDRAEVDGLVVTGALRDSGVGTRLLDRAEQWARERNARAVRLLSNVVREAAHEFYQRRGYHVLKTQHAFQKIL